MSRTAKSARPLSSIGISVGGSSAPVGADFRNHYLCSELKVVSAKLPRDAPLRASLFSIWLCSPLLQPRVRRSCAERDIVNMTFGPVLIRCRNGQYHHREIQSVRLSFTHQRR